MNCSCILNAQGDWSSGQRETISPDPAIIFSPISAASVPLRPLAIRKYERRYPVARRPHFKVVAGRLSSLFESAGEIEAAR